MLMLASLDLFMTPIRVPTGYYTLKELAAVVSKQGTALKADPSCAQDVYAVRLDGVSRDNLLSALVADDRLSVIEGTIRRISTREKADAAALSHYIDSVRGAINRVYRPTTTKAGALLLQSDDERAEAQAQLTTGKKDALMEKVDRLVYQIVCFQEEPLLTASVPAALTEPHVRRPFGKAILTTMLESPGLVTPDGKLRSKNFLGTDTSQLSDEDLAKAFGLSYLAVKLSWDPITATVTSRNIFYNPQTSASLIDEIEGFWPKSICPEVVKPNVSAKDLFPREDLPALEARKRISQEVAQELALSPPAPSPARGQRTTEALLRCADSGRFSVLAYVSPVADLPLRINGKQSVSSVLSAASSGSGIDLTSLSRVLRERTSPKTLPTPSLAISDMPRLTINRFGTILSVRNELAFLDGACDASAALSTKLLNRQYQGKPVTLSAIVREVAAMRPSRWQFSCAPAYDFDFCNPASFYPIAAAYTLSPDLRMAVSGLIDGEATSLKLSRLGPRADQALREAIVNVAPYNDYFAAGMHDPLLVQAYIRSPDLEFDLRIARERTGYSFQLMHNKVCVWSTWANGVATEK